MPFRAAIPIHIAACLSRELRRQKLVSAAMQKHGLKAAGKRERLRAEAEAEADATLERLVSRSP
jgi:hypothetical protein